jgi:FixJ family two-component response regulator
MMSGQAHIEMAVRATKLGAIDFLEKPISTDKLLLTVENVSLQRLEPRTANCASASGNMKSSGSAKREKVMAQVDASLPPKPAVHPRRNRHRQGTGRAHAT